MASVMGLFSSGIVLGKELSSENEENRSCQLPIANCSLPCSICVTLRKSASNFFRYILSLLVSLSVHLFNPSGVASFQGRPAMGCASFVGLPMVIDI